MVIDNNFIIRLCDHGSQPQSYAGKTLSEYLSFMTDGRLTLDIDQKNSNTEKKTINIGKFDSFKSFFPKAELGDDGILIALYRGDLYLCGESDRAVIYSVYEFLEYLGCRFFSVDCEKIPHREKIEVDDELYICKTPDFSYRDVYWTCVYDPILSLKLHLNGALRNQEGYGRRLLDNLGGGVRYAGPHFVHTFYMMLPPEEYFETHPEYFALINGERTCKHLYTQLCLSNPDVLDIITEKTKQWCRDNPDAKIVSVSQNDSFVIESYCTCEKCAAIDREEGSPSGSLIRFVNKVAERVEEEFPDVYIDTLAYQYSVKAPKYVKPRKNVIVRLCTGGCYTHPIDECEQNRATKEAFEDWSRICNKLYVWDYTTNFLQYMAPFANMAAMRKNIKFFRAHNVKGVFMQGNYQPGENGEFGELRSYLMAKALWDADCDMDALAKEFIETYYGGGAKYIMEYLKYIYSHGLEVHFNWAMPSSAMWAKVIPDSDLPMLDNIWKMAKAESCGIALEHVRRSELSHRWYKLEACKGEFADEKTREQRQNEFYKDCAELGVERVSEGANIPAGNCIT